MNKTKAFFDFEASSVARDADMISVGLIAVTEKKPLYKINDDFGLSNGKYPKYLYDLFKSLDMECRELVGKLLTEEEFHNLPFTDEEWKYCGTTIKNQEIKTFYCEFDDFSLEKCDDWVRENIVDKLVLNKRALQKDKLGKVFGDFNNFEVKGNQHEIKNHLQHWLSQFESVEFYCDFGVIDTPMLIDLISDWDKQSFDELGYKMKYEMCHKSGYDRPVDKEGFMHLENQDGCTTYKVGLPKHLPNVKYYDFYDIHSILKWKGIDPDVNREEFAFSNGEGLLSHIETLNELNIPKQKHNALWDAYVCYKMYEKLKSM